MKNRISSSIALALVASASFSTPTIADVAQQLALSAQSLEMWSTGDTSGAGEVFLDSYQNHQTPDVEGGPKTVDLEEWKATVAGFRTGFPDTKVEILEQFGEGPLVSTRWRFTGVQTGAYLGLAPSGKRSRGQEFRSTGSKMEKSTKPG